jgi:[ribosomal protein S18]-alanine N-acetyltransferase
MSAFHPGITPAMLLRPFRPNDLQTLYEIDQACFVPGISYTRNELTSFISHRHSQTWVAEEGGEITGFLIAHPQPRKILHIITIDVREAWRRRRVGSLLMDAAEQWARDRDLRLIGLETARDNLVAQRFYAARGYRKVDEIEHYYADGKSAWVMVKELP